MDKVTNHAPIVIFAFNRLEPLKACVSSLLANPESKDSDLIVFVDGPRFNKEGETEKVQSVRNYVKSITGFKSLHYFYSDSNKGLATSIISGVTEMINKYKKVIVLEDDLVVAPSFLSFINTMLYAYEKDSRIMQITGFGPKIRKSETYKCDYYLSGRAHSWSWATWKNRWDTIDWKVSDYDRLCNSKIRQKAFNEFGSDLFGMLKGWHDGRANSWYIRFDYAMHKQRKYCIAPLRSLVRNDGFCAGATHTSVFNRYKVDFDNEGRHGWTVSENLVWNEKLAKEAVKYWSIPYRIYGKIMTYLTSYMR